MSHWFRQCYNFFWVLVVSLLVCILRLDDVCLIFLIQSHLHLLCVRMEKYVWSMEVVPLRDEWKFVSTTHGAQCVMMDGMMMMLELSADNLDYPLYVSLI